MVYFLLMEPIGILSPEVCKANATMIMTMLLPLLIFSTVGLQAGDDIQRLHRYLLTHQIQVVRSFDPGNLSAVLVLVLSGIMYAGMHK